MNTAKLVECGSGWTGSRYVIEFSWGGTFDILPEGELYEETAMAKAAEAIASMKLVNLIPQDTTLLPGVEDRGML